MVIGTYESESESRPVVSDSLQPHGLYSPWNSLGQNTGVGSLSLLQGIFPTQGSNPGLLHRRQTLYQLSHKGSPYISIITLNVNGLNASTKRHRLAGEMKRCACMHFHLPHHSALTPTPQIVCNYFILLS